MKVTKAFSLLEIIIVLAILAVIMGLGWSGLTNFRATTELQNAYSELVSVVKTVQNKAKNSVSSSASGVTPDFYTLFFTNNKYYSFNCVKTSKVSNTVRCTKDDSIIFRLLPDGILITPEDKCKGVGFGKLNGKFTSFVLPSNTSLDSINVVDSTFDQTGLCNIKISHKLISNEKNIEINFDNSSINVK